MKNKMKHSIKHYKRPVVKSFLSRYLVVDVVDDNLLYGYRTLERFDSLFKAECSLPSYRLKFPNSTILRLTYDFLNY